MLHYTFIYRATRQLVSISERQVVALVSWLYLRVVQNLYLYLSLLFRIHVEIWGRAGALWGIVWGGRRSVSCEALWHAAKWLRSTHHKLIGSSEAWHHWRSTTKLAPETLLTESSLHAWSELIEHVSSHRGSAHHALILRISSESELISCCEAIWPELRAQAHWSELWA